jgi:hypothetical protein
MGLRPGTSLGYCEIDALLGVGGMGEVYRGRDTQLCRDVALPGDRPPRLRACGMATATQGGEARQRNQNLTQS